MKVLMVEDDNRAGCFADFLANYGYTVKLVDNMFDAMTELDDFEKYDAVLLDLALDGRYLPEQYMKDKVFHDGLLSGCVFHIEVMVPKYPALAEKTIFFTGVSQTAKETAPEWYKKYSSRIVPKTESAYKERIMTQLKMWDNK